MLVTNVCTRKAHGKSKNVFKEETQTMKKSEAYNLAQIAVITTSTISPENKLEILRVLIAEENLALYCEEQEV